MMNYTFIDTHSHLDGEEFKDDLDEVIARAKEMGVSRIFLPGVDKNSIDSVSKVSRRYPEYCLPMIGLQPEEVKADWKEVLSVMKERLDHSIAQDDTVKYIAIGECGLDFYWSREFEKEQLQAFEEQVKWSVETRLPLMIHCRKAQNELLHILKDY